MKTTPLFQPLRLRRRGAQLVVANEQPSYESKVLTALARAFYWQSLLDAGLVASSEDIAALEGVHRSDINKQLRLTLLAPDIVALLLKGKQPRSLMREWFQRNAVPPLWEEQRQILKRMRDETPSCRPRASAPGNDTA